MAFCPSRREEPLTPSCTRERSWGTASLGRRLAFTILGTRTNFPQGQMSPEGIPFGPQRGKNKRERSRGCSQAEGCLRTAVWHVESTPHT